MHKDRPSKLSISIPASEREFIAEAAKASRAVSVSQFVREAAIAQAKATLGRDIRNQQGPAIQAAGQTDVLTAYAQAARPDRLSEGEIVVPSIKRFTTIFSDRNRALLHWIGCNQPQSLYELSKRFRYPYSPMIQHLKGLEELGVIAHVELGDRNRAPYLKCCGLRLLLPFGESFDEQGDNLRLRITSSDEQHRPHDADITYRLMKEFSGLLSDHGWAFARLIKEHRPSSVAELGLLSGKSVQNSFLLIDKLTKLGVMNQNTAGRRKELKVVKDGLEIHLPFEK